MKTVRFENPKYIGDPMNAVRIFNEKFADEIMILDINASSNGIDPDFRLIERLAAQCRMPMCYGGGISTADQADRIIQSGVEKVAISSAALRNDLLIPEIVRRLGSSSVACVLDVKRKKTFFKKEWQIFTHNGLSRSPLSLEEAIKKLVSFGAGEIIINCIHNDGVMLGYDIELAKYVRGLTTVPISLIGGASSFSDFEKLSKAVGPVGAVAGSYFVFKGKYRAVLISYPSLKERASLEIEDFTGRPHFDG